MPRGERDGEEDNESEGLAKGLVRDLLVAGIIVVLVLVGIYAYTGVWPPLVVVESKSMQHSDTESYIGVIDTGDMVLQQAAPNRGDVITYIEGRARGYATYGDRGDVIIFRRPLDPTPVIHRAIMYVTLHANGTMDIPDLALLPSGWQGTNATGSPTMNPFFLRSVTIHGMGFRQDLGITFESSRFPFGARSGYVTMGDGNAYGACSSQRDPCLPGVPYDTQWLPRQQDVIGRARGEIPWFGLLKLTLQPTDTCCRGWGDSGGLGDEGAPKNSWDSLAASLVVLLALPFILEFGVRAWKRYVSPRLPEIRWPWRRKKAGAGEGSVGEDPGDSGGTAPSRPKKPPREESSGP